MKAERSPITERYRTPFDSPEDVHIGVVACLAKGTCIRSSTVPVDILRITFALICAVDAVRFSTVAFKCLSILVNGSPVIKPFFTQTLASSVFL